MAGPVRVLLVDDDPSLADLMASQLGSLREEFSVRVETDPNDALEAVEADDIDCVVSDYHMPEMNGLELLQYVREMDPNIPFILFTARGSEEIASEAVSEGVTDYFRKRRGSEQWRVLANRIENVAARYRAEEAVQRRESALRQLARTVIDSVSTPIEELLELGRETLELEYSAVVEHDGDNGEQLVESVSDDLPFETDGEIPLADDIDGLTVDGSGIVAVATGEKAEPNEGFSAYVGTPVYVGDQRYGTLCFCDSGPRSEFTAWERAFVELLGDWLGHELTSEWARDQSESVRSAQSRLTSAREALDAGDKERVRDELEVIRELLDQNPPSSVPVSIELS
ncbi:receiver box response regulator [Natronomonas pharaonis DSM 2160]|uniref:Receiver box response regulator n=1 Tax=Natronomonas pharaonis (strain ATCC 35678 / DSM 2160 / CIP 103997 / JCM 8858 / NBRC 14720 / NCIMB 2260 / Gabara) TaxID=348780 RepID=A0A1U7EWJ6_NATPD|nr:response regulator [Natronomonas pharaonis]CAI49449.1 receiver box response regulator [Natronomonas pharaonis DSM 2160]